MKLNNKFLSHSHRVLFRYALFQLPDLFILILILFILRYFLRIPGYAIGAAIAFWILKDIVLYPFVGRFYDPDFQKDWFSMVGKKGIVKKSLKPKRKILVKGELWLAEVLEKDMTINTGETVVIQGIKGLNLLVMPAISQKIQANDPII
jgi:membrane protein implicated in regulation of membrane protease activity